MAAMRFSERGIVPFTHTWLGFRALCVLGLLPLGLRFLSLNRLVALLTPGHIPSRQRRDIVSLAAFVDTLIDRRPFRFYGHCLRRSLVLYYVATRSGYAVRLAVGVRTTPNEQLTGHGWLEYQGEPFLEPGPSPRIHFAVMRHLP